MKRFFLILFCIAAVSDGIFYAVSIPHDHFGYALNGVLDLRGAVFDEAAYILGGEREFYWSRLYEPKDFIDTVGRNEERIRAYIESKMTQTCKKML